MVSTRFLFVGSFALRAALAWTWVATLVPAESSAQGGRASVFVAGVADAQTGQPLEGAEVLIVRVSRIGRANAMGEAVIPGIAQGPQRVRVRRLGYVPLDVDVAVAGDTSGAVFRLRRSVTELGTVHVEAEWMPPMLRDVDVRRKQGIGRFLEAEQLAKEADREFALVAAARFPGLRAVPDSTGHLVLASTREQLSIKHNNTGQISVCYPSVYLDNVLLQPSNEDLVRTWDLAVVEFYTGLQVPVRYRTGSYGCGVLLLWSKWY